MASTSYDVFLSFRGEDTRKNFTDRLYNSLKQAGVYTFRDDNGIERGENIKSELQKAIQNSRISILVLSRNYATSRWCLDELVLILERYKTSGHVILPVFYHVEKSLFNGQAGSTVSKAIDVHEEGFKEEECEEKRMEGFERLKGWKAALKQVAEFGAMTLKKQADIEQEMKFIKKVVKVIEDKLSRTAMSSVPQLIGMKYRTVDINLWLRDETTNVSIYVISGIGGIGKTTIAQYIYNLNSNLFEYSSFLKDVRETAEEHQGVVRLQKQLLCDILKTKQVNVSSVDEGTLMIKQALRFKPALLVLDDVDKPDLVDVILGMREGFCLGSKIIITTRFDWTVNPSEAFKIYKVESLDYKESLDLFCWHAFGQDFAFEGYLEQSKRVVKLCEGLPLALQVLGSALSGKKLDVWESVLEKLEAIPNYQIVKKLKLSYDNLQDDHDKSLFLHIACFFVGMDKYITTSVLDCCDYFTSIGIQNLIDKNLVEIDDCNKLVMHQVIRDLGRGIVRQESPMDPGKRSRLWHYKDSFNVLTRKNGTETVEGIIFDLDGRSSTSMDSSSSLANYVETDSFARMLNLKLLKLNSVSLTGHYKEFPKRLRWLSWRHCSLRSIPSNFPLENIVVIDIRYSSLKQIWKGVKFLGSLKILNLSHSWELKKIPDLSGLPKIEKLILKDCVKLVKIHESISGLKNIILLNLKDCRSLRNLPKNIGALKSLETLDISGCLSLQWVPMQLSMLKSLKVLRGDELDFNKLRFQPWRNSFISCIYKPRSDLEQLSWSFLPCNLIDLSLVNCNLSDDAFAVDFRSLSMLENLDIGGNLIHSLPESFKSLSKLGSFNVQNCTRLKSLVGLPNVKELFIEHCTSLEKITYQSALSKKPSITHANDNDNLMTLQGVFKLEDLKSIDPQMLNYFDLNLESIEETEVKLTQYTSSRKKNLPLQGLYEQGVFSIFIPGNKIPSFFLKTTHRAVSFNIAPNFKVQGLSMATFYSKKTLAVNASADDKTQSRDYWQANRVELQNSTKGLTWVHRPTIFGVPADHEGMTWLSHWSFGTTLLLEGGDEVKITVSLKSHRFTVEEFGLHLVGDVGESCHNNSDKLLNSVIVSNPFFVRDVVPGDSSQRGRLYKIPTWS